MLSFFSILIMLNTLKSTVLIHTQLLIDNRINNIKLYFSPLKLNLSAIYVSISDEIFTKVNHNKGQKYLKLYPSIHK